MTAAASQEAQESRQIIWSQGTICV